jgi:hypothetical protein
LISAVTFKTCVGLAAAVLLGGCATTSFTSGGASYDPNLPRTFLSGADIAQAKGVAMGSAVSKGWTVSRSSADTLVLQRTLNAAAAESVSPGASLAPLPSLVEVRSSFFQRDNGVDVVLDAQVVTGRGTDKEEKLDYTDGYRQELMRSLASLRQAWSQSGWRVASAVPPLSTAAASADASQDSADSLLEDPVPTAWGSVEAPRSEAAAQAFDTEAPEPRNAAQTPDPGGLEEASVAGPDAPAAASVEAEARAPAQLPAPAPAAADVSRVEAVPTSVSEPAPNMLALTRPTDSGVWSYYAEHYARVRGCSPTDGGAVLVEKENYSETHRVDCAGGRSFMVRCNAGVCRSLR